MEYLIIGIAIDLNKSSNVKSRNFSFPYLAEWYEGWEHANKLSGLNGKLTEIGSATSEHLLINDNLELVFTDVIRSSVKEFNFTYEINYNKYVQFNYANPVSFSQVVEDSLLLQKLLEFSHRKPLNRKLISVEIGDEFSKKQREEKQGSGISYYVHNFSLTKNKEVAKSGSHSVHMIFCRGVLSKEDLNSVIVKWFSSPNLTNIIEYFLDTDNWFPDQKDAVLSNVMFNNRFLNLIQGLEDYHREYIATEAHDVSLMAFEQKKTAVLQYIADPELKQWVNNTFKRARNLNLSEKLASVVTAVTPIISSIFGEASFESFSNSASKARNDLSHGLKKNIDLGDRLHLDYHIAQLILLVCILQALRVPNIEKLLLRNFKLQRTMQEIRFLQQKYSSY